MHEVSRARHQTAKCVGRCLGTLWLRRCFNSMNIQVNRKRMLRIALEYRLEGGENLLGQRLWILWIEPVVPRHGVHHRLCKQCCRVVIFRIFVMQFPQCIDVCLIERFALCRGVTVVTCGQRVNVIALGCRGIFPERHCPLNGGKCAGPFIIAHHDFAIACHVDIRSKRQRLAPETHGALRIERLCGAE